MISLSDHVKVMGVGVGVLADCILITTQVQILAPQFWSYFIFPFQVSFKEFNFEKVTTLELESPVVFI